MKRMKTGHRTVNHDGSTRMVRLDSIATMGVVAKRATEEPTVAENAQTAVVSFTAYIAKPTSQ